MSNQPGGYGQPPNIPQQQMVFNQQHMMGRQIGQMGVQRQISLQPSYPVFSRCLMYPQDSGLSQQQSQMQMHFSQQQQMQQMSQQQMSQMPPQMQTQQQQQMQMGMQQHLAGQHMGLQQQQQQQQQQQMAQQQAMQQHLQQTNQMGQQSLHSGQTQLASMMGGSLGSVSQQHMQMQQPCSPVTSSVGPQQLTPSAGPGSQTSGSTLVVNAGGPTSVGPMSVQPHTPMNPSSQQAIQQPSSVQAGPASVAPGTPASNQPASQPPTLGEPAEVYFQDPVAQSKQLIMKDLRFCIIDLNRRAGEALKDLRAGNVPSNSNEYLKAMDNLFAVCDEIEGNLILVCETQKQMSKMEKIFDKDVTKSGEANTGYSDSKARNLGNDDDSSAYFSAVNAYIDQTKELQAAFDRAFSHVGRTLETIRKRQNMSRNIERDVKMEE